MRKKILIAEDETLIAEHLRRIVSNNGFEVSDTCSNLKSAITSIEQNAPDLALLDIRMNGEDQGIEIAKYLSKLNIPFIFITSFNNKQILKDTISLSPRAFLLKPFEKEEVLELIAGVFKGQKEDYFKVVSSKKVEMVKYDEIVFFNSNNVYVDIQTTTGKLTFRAKLNDLHAMLPASNFWRVHQSYIVNKDFITKLEKDELTLNEYVIPISRKYKGDLLSNLSKI